MTIDETTPDHAAARPSRRPSIGVIVAAIITIILILDLTQLHPTVKHRIESMLRDAGFEHVVVGELSLRPSGFRASSIKLDSYGFDEIKQLDADLSWPAFLTSGKVSQLRIDGMSLSRADDSLSSGTQQIAQNILHLPAYRIEISNVTLDLATQFGAIRLTIDATADPSDDASHKIKASIAAAQYQLGFTSAWEGTLKPDGQLDIAGNIVDGRLNLGPLRVSRFNGWSGLSITGGNYSIQSQIEAGSAAFMDVPLQTISLVTDLNRAQKNIIVRSGVSGMPDILFTADMIGPDDSRNFTAILKGKNLGGLLDYVDEVTKTEKVIDEKLLSMREFELTTTFQPEKRFVGGPMPFGITLQTDKNKILDGNVLFYPDTLDVRGSLETEADLALALRDYFKIPSENIKQNFIRLDGDAKRFFTFEEPSLAKSP